MNFKEKIAAFASLFTSLSTIFCCALPIILVTLGFGAVFASISAKFPLISILAQNANALFATATAFLILSGYFIFFKNQSCPANKKQAELCAKTKKINKIIWILSATILIFSSFLKYILILIIK